MERLDYFWIWVEHYRLTVGAMLIMSALFEKRPGTGGSFPALFDSFMQESEVSIEEFNRVFTAWSGAIVKAQEVLMT